MYNSQNIIYNKYKEENYERERLLSSAGSNTHFFFVCVLNAKTNAVHRLVPQGCMQRKTCG